MKSMEKHNKKDEDHNPVAKMSVVGSTRLAAPPTADVPAEAHRAAVPPRQRINGAGGAVEAAWPVDGALNASRS